MIVGGLLAGGIGSRMHNAVLPKQFLEIDELPVIIRTLKAFRAEERISSIVVAMNPQWMEYCSHLLKRHGLAPDAIHLISGGEDRFASMQNIIQYCADTWGEDTIVVVHDCARPFVSKRILSENIDLKIHYDAVTTSVPAIDTVIISEDGKQSDFVPERSKMFLDQGPQTMLAGDFLELTRSITPEKREEYREAGRLYLDHNRSVGIVAGDRMNFKITTEFDLQFAEYLLKTHKEF